MVTMCQAHSLVSFSHSLARQLLLTPHFHRLGNWGKRGQGDCSWSPTSRWCSSHFNGGLSDSKALALLASHPAWLQTLFWITFCFFWSEHTGKEITFRRLVGKINTLHGWCRHSNMQVFGCLDKAILKTKGCWSGFNKEKEFERGIGDKYELFWKLLLQRGTFFQRW